MFNSRSSQSVAFRAVISYFLINQNIRRYQEMDIAKITARGQTTIPKRIREAVNLHEGDLISFEVEGKRVVVHKVMPRPDGYLVGVAEGLGEWATPEDEEAWRDL